MAGSKGGWQSAAGQLYRRVLHSRWADGLQSGVEQRPGYAAHDGRNPTDAQLQQSPATDANTGTTGLREVTVILNCTHSTASAMARRFPGLLDMTSAQLQSRLMQMKVSYRLAAVVCNALHHDCQCITLESRTSAMSQLCRLAGAATKLRCGRARTAVSQVRCRHTWDTAKSHSSHLTDQQSTCVSSPPAESLPCH